MGLRAFFVFGCFGGSEMVETVVRHSGGKSQVRKVNGRWSKAVRAKFLGHLAVSCNVAASCRKAGVSDTAAYRLRQTDAGSAPTGWWRSPRRSSGSR